MPFDALVYPCDEQAQIGGQSFAGKSITECVQYRTCEQLQQGEPLHSLLYYRWTLEKLARFGEKFEALLHHEAKGCNVTGRFPQAGVTLPQADRYQLLAENAAAAFVSLYESVMTDWQPELSSSRNIVFFRKLGGKFTIAEGRHRLAILTFKFSDRETVEAFRTDASLVRNDYYVHRARNAVRHLRQRLTG